MDLGNATYTEFHMNEDVASYMAEHMELFNCELMLIHSHHQMSTQPSGTDLNTLREEGNDRNCFVSLIVNNAGNYYAAITRKVHSKLEVTTKNLGTSYEFFGEGTRDISKKDAVSTKTIDKEVIQYFDLEVKRYEVVNNLSYLDDRFEEIMKKKNVSNNNGNRYAQPPAEDYGDFFGWMHDSKRNRLAERELDMFKEDKKKHKEENIKSAVENWQPSAKVIHEMVCKMITCNLIINPDKFDLKQWVHNHMVKVYDRIFNSKLVWDGHDPFGEWKDFIVQFLLDYVDPKDAPDALMEDWDLLVSRYAQAMYDELSKFADENAYIVAYQDALECYIIE